MLGRVQQVGPICAAVQKDGDKAVKSYTSQFDKVELEEIVVKLAVRALGAAARCSSYPADWTYGALCNAFDILFSLSEYPWLNITLKPTKCSRNRYDNDFLLSSASLMSPPLTTVSCIHTHVCVVCASRAEAQQEEAVEWDVEVSRVLLATFFHTGCGNDVYVLHGTSGELELLRSAELCLRKACHVEAEHSRVQLEV